MDVFAYIYTSVCLASAMYLSIHLYHLSICKSISMLSFYKLFDLVFGVNLGQCSSTKDCETVLWKSECFL